jgi:hypothetical protein
MRALRDAAIREMEFAALRPARAQPVDRTRKPGQGLLSANRCSTTRRRDAAAMLGHETQAHSSINV